VNLTAISVDVHDPVLKTGIVSAPEGKLSLVTA
jgi:hypothetical protein